MKLFAAFCVLLAALVIWTYAAADHGTTTTVRTDVDGNGQVNVIDLQQVASHHGEFVTPNPCLTAIVYDQTVRPTATIINSLGTPYEPWGYTLVLRSDHPLYQSIKDGTPASVWAC